jgi:hypothetical protein
MSDFLADHHVRFSFTTNGRRGNRHAAIKRKAKSYRTGTELALDGFVAAAVAGVVPVLVATGRLERSRSAAPATC